MTDDFLKLFIINFVIYLYTEASEEEWVNPQKY